MPVSNTDWFLLHNGYDVNIGLRRTRVISVLGVEESSDWDHTIQEQQDVVIEVSPLPVVRPHTGNT